MSPDALLEHALEVVGEASRALLAGAFLGVDTLRPSGTVRE